MKFSLLEYCAGLFDYTNLTKREVLKHVDLAIDKAGKDLDHAKAEAVAMFIYENRKYFDLAMLDLVDQELDPKYESAIAVMVDKLFLQYVSGQSCFELCKRIDYFLTKRFPGEERGVTFLPGVFLWSEIKHKFFGFDELKIDGVHKNGVLAAMNQRYLKLTEAEKERVLMHRLTKRIIALEEGQKNLVSLMDEIKDISVSVTDALDSLNKLVAGGRDIDKSMLLKINNLEVALDDAFKKINAVSGKTYTPPKADKLVPEFKSCDEPCDEPCDEITHEDLSPLAQGLVDTGANPCSGTEVDDGLVKATDPKESLKLKKRGKTRSERDWDDLMDLSERVISMSGGYNTLSWMGLLENINTATVCNTNMGTTKLKNAIYNILSEEGGISSQRLLCLDTLMTASDCLEAAWSVLSKDGIQDLDTALLSYLKGTPENKQQDLFAAIENEHEIELFDLKYSLPY